MEPALVPVRHRLVEVRAPLGPLDGPAELAGEQAEGNELRVRCDLVAEAAADVLGDEAQLVEADPQRRAHHDRREPRELVVRVDRPLPRAAVVLDQRAVALDRRRVEAVEVELVDPHHVVGLVERGAEITPLVDACPGEIRADLLVQHRRLLVQRDPRVDDDRKRVVVDLDHVGGVPGELPRRCGHGDHGLARVANLADREREIAHVRPGGRRDLEERVGRDGDLVARQRAENTRQLERSRDVDREDLRVRVRGTHEVHVPHAVPPDIVDEDALALDEALVLLARNRLSLVGAALELDPLRRSRRHALTSPRETARIASTIPA